MNDDKVLGAGPARERDEGVLAERAWPDKPIEERVDDLVHRYDHLMGQVLELKRHLEMGRERPLVKDLELRVGCLEGGYTAADIGGKESTSPVGELHKELWEQLKQAQTDAAFAKGLSEGLLVRVDGLDGAYEGLRQSLSDTDTLYCSLSGRLRELEQAKVVDRILRLEGCDTNAFQPSWDESQAATEEEDDFPTIFPDKLPVKVELYEDGGAVVTFQGGARIGVSASKVEDVGRGEARRAAEGLVEDIGDSEPPADAPAAIGPPPVSVELQTDGGAVVVLADGSRYSLPPQVVETVEDTAEEGMRRVWRESEREQKWRKDSDRQDGGDRVMSDQDKIHGSVSHEELARGRVPEPPEAAGHSLNKRLEDLRRDLDQLQKRVQSHRDDFAQHMGAPRSHYNQFSVVGERLDAIEKRAADLRKRTENLEARERERICEGPEELEQRVEVLEARADTVRYILEDNGIAKGLLNRVKDARDRLDALESKTRGLEYDDGAAEDDGPKQEEPRARSGSDGGVYRKRTDVWTVCFTTGKNEKHEMRYTMETESLADLIKWLTDLLPAGEGG